MLITTLQCAELINRQHSALQRHSTRINAYCQRQEYHKLAKISREPIKRFLQVMLTKMGSGHPKIVLNRM